MMLIKSCNMYSMKPWQPCNILSTFKMTFNVVSNDQHEPAGTIKVTRKVISNYLDGIFTQKIKINNIKAQNITNNYCNNVWWIQRFVKMSCFPLIYLALPQVAHKLFLSCSFTNNSCNSNKTLKRSPCVLEMDICGWFSSTLNKWIQVVSLRYDWLYAVSIKMNAICFSQLVSFCLEITFYTWLSSDFLTSAETTVNEKQRASGLCISSGCGNFPFWPRLCVCFGLEFQFWCELDFR